MNRKLSMIALGSVSVAVYRNSDLNEFEVRLTIDGEHLESSDYFTNSLADANSTALRILEAASAGYAASLAGKHSNPEAAFQDWLASRRSTGSLN